MSLSERYHQLDCMQIEAQCTLCQCLTQIPPWLIYEDPKQSKVLEVKNKKLIAVP